MKVFVIAFTLSLVVLGFLGANLVVTVSKINENTDLLRQFTEVSNDAAVNREHKLQDSLEERIGTLEHEIDSLKTVLGQTK